MRKITLVYVAAAISILAASGGCLANDATKPAGPPDWPRARFSASELQELQIGDFEAESHFCGCYDKPNKHFPYAVVLLKTSNGDLVARPERHEGAVTYTPLAVRLGIRYCELGSETQCYGSFPSPCDFIDFRYGPQLEPFFPTCKAE